ncbi:MAG TPA: ABC transporter permease [Bacillota bacterium]|nr:ABC transporter permease [Bacillota bacterium]
MIPVLQTRLLHLKKKWLSFLFWMVFPIVLTCIMIQGTNSIQQETKIPVGMVVEDDSDIAVSLIDSLDSSPLIRVKELNQQDALRQLEKHELDSVFIIPDGYKEQIRKGSRNRLVTGYASDLSMAYSPVKELLLSYVQQDTARSKAAYTIKQISESYNGGHNWTWDEIVEKSIAIQNGENLIHTAFSFFNATSPTNEANFQLWNTWGLWSIFALLATLLLFDWIIKETRSNVTHRFHFMRISLERYHVISLLFYVGLFIIIDAATMVIFHYFFREEISFSFLYSLIMYRSTISIGVFLLANMFKNVYVYYSLSFIITLVGAIISGAILPIEGITSLITWLQYIDPIQAFLMGEISYISLFLFLIWGMVWFAWKEKKHA